MQVSADQVRLFGTFFKPYPLVENDWLTPVGVDGFRPPNGLTADTGTNIATRHSFCEVRVHYWVRHNLHVPYVGFYHYRRYFNFVQLRQREGQSYFRFPCDDKILAHLSHASQLAALKAQLRVFDVVAARPSIYSVNLATQFRAGHIGKPWEAYMRALWRLRPKLAAQVGWYDVATYAHFMNMFVMSWELFCAYMDDLMPILDAVAEECGELTDDPYQARYVSFIAERFLPFWIHFKKLSCFGVQVFRIDDGSENAPGSGA